MGFAENRSAKNPIPREGTKRRILKSIGGGAIIAADLSRGRSCTQEVRFDITFARIRSHHYSVVPILRSRTLAFHEGRGVCMA